MMKENVRQPCSTIYGALQGQDVGCTFKTRRDLNCTHNSKFVIAVGPEGALSIILNRKHILNDRGVFFAYITGESQKVCDGKYVEAEGELNKNLVLSYKSQLPIRIFRSASLRNDFAPKVGYRYDGLYHVKSYEIEQVKAKLVFKFEFSRLENQAPGPWENQSHCCQHDDLVEITAELSPSLRHTPSRNSTLRLDVVDSFSLNTIEYSQIESDMFYKEEVTDDQQVDCSILEAKPLVLSSDSNLLDVLTASGVISKGTRVAEPHGCNAQSYQIFDCNDDSDWEGDDPLTSGQFKSESLDIKSEFNVSNERISEDVGLAEEEEGEGSVVCDYNENDTVDCDESDDDVKPDSKDVLPILRNTHYSSPFVQFDEEEDFDNDAEPVEVIPVVANTPAESLILYDPLTDQVELDESSQTYRYNPDAKASTSGDIVAVLQRPVGKDEFIMVAPQYLSIIPDHLLPEEESKKSGEDKSEKKGGIQTFTFDGKACSSVTINESTLHSEEEETPFWHDPNSNPPPEYDSKDIETSSLNLDIKTSQDNIKPTLDEKRATSVHCTCAPPQQPVEHLLGELTSNFFLFYYDFFCKCKSNSSNRINGFFDKITQVIEELKVGNVNHLSSIVAFLLYCSKKDVLSDSPPPVVSQSEKTERKVCMVLTDCKNDRYELIEENGKYSLICRKTVDSSMERFPLDRIEIGDDLFNDDSLFHSLKHISGRFFQAPRLENTPPKKRAHPSIGNKVGRRIKRKKRDSTTDATLVENRFLGFTPLSVRVSEMTKDTWEEITSLKTADFKGFKNVDLRRTTHSNQGFTRFLKSKPEFRQDF